MLYAGFMGYVGCLGEAQFAAPEDGALAHWLEAIGAPGAEIMMEGPAWASLAHGARVTRHLLDGFGGRLALHGPLWDLNLGSYRPETRAVALGRLVEAVEAAAELGADHLVVHPFAWETPDFDGQRWRHALGSLLALCDVAARRGVTLGVENLPDPDRSPDGLERYLELIERLPPPAQALLDVGHAHLSGWDIIHAIRRLGERLGAVHLHDNHGQRDDHLPVWAGTVAWDAIFAALGAAPSDCRWVTEYLGTDEALLREHLALLRARWAEAVAA